MTLRYRFLIYPRFFSVVDFIDLADITTHKKEIMTLSMQVVKAIFQSIPPMW